MERGRIAGGRLLILTHATMAWRGGGLTLMNRGGLARTFSPSRNPWRERQQCPPGRLGSLIILRDAAGNPVSALANTESSVLAFSLVVLTSFVTQVLPSQESLFSLSLSLSLSLSRSALTKCVRLNLLLQPTAERHRCLVCKYLPNSLSLGSAPSALFQPLHRHDHGHASEACS